MSGVEGRRKRSADAQNGAFEPERTVAIGLAIARRRRPYQIFYRSENCKPDETYANEKTDSVECQPQDKARKYEEIRRSLAKGLGQISRRKLAGYVPTKECRHQDTDPREARALRGRRVEVDIKSRDLAVPCDDEIHTGVLGRFAFRPRAPRQASRIVQNLGRAMRRINEMGMRRSEIASELVQCVVTDERAGRRV
jgi:hypothetical protein